MSQPQAVARRHTVTANVGGVLIGSGHPVVVQSMTNTDTADAEGTAIQVAQLARAGSELVRITVNTPQAAAAVPEIAQRLADLGLDVPIVGDFHYNGHLLLREFPETARLLAKYRINPGNVGAGQHHDANFATMIEVAKEFDKPVRIGVNWGSLDQSVLARLMDNNARLSSPRSGTDVMIDAMVVSALESARYAETLGLAHDKILISVKVSSAPLTASVSAIRERPASCGIRIRPVSACFQPLPAGTPRSRAAITSSASRDVALSGRA